MPKVSKGRRVGQAAVNALRTLLEEHDHIVQEISGCEFDSRPPLFLEPPGPDGPRGFFAAPAARARASAWRSDGRRPRAVSGRLVARLGS